MKAGEEIYDIRTTLQNARKGDKHAFESLYTEYFTPVFRYIYLRVRDKNEVESLAQDVFLKVYKNISHMNEETENPLPYFFTIARNTIIDYWRKNRTQVDFGKDDILLQVPDTGPGTDALARERELRTILYKGLNMLPTEQREVIIMRYFEDVPYADISKMVGKSEDVVRQYVSRGIKRLRDILAELNS